MAIAYFSEKQRFTQPWLWILILGITGLFWFGAFRQLVQGIEWGTSPAPDLIVAILWLLAGVGLPLVFAVARLETEVRDDGIQVRFFPIHLRPRALKWDDIANVKVREYAPLREYGGWGVRIGPRGWAYNVRGNHGVELTFRAGNRLLIGTQDPESFLRAVQAGLGNTSTV